MQNNAKNTILMTLMVIAIAVTGLVGYYQEIRWLFIACAIVCFGQFVLNLFVQPLRDEMFTWLTLSFVVGYYITDNILDAVCFGICLYFATVLINALLPVQLLLIVVPIVSIVSYFLGAEHVFIATAAYCFTFFFVKLLRGKHPPFAMELFLSCVTVGVLLLFQRDTDVYLSIKMLKGILWGSTAYYIAIAIYALYRVRKKDKNLDILR